MRKNNVLLPLIALIAAASLLTGCASLRQSLWRRAHEVAYKTAAQLRAQHEQEMREGLFFRKILYGNPFIKAVALTFDDGPHPVYTREILSILARYNVKATFFVVGKMAEVTPELIRAESAAGHLIANHTYNHINLNHLPVGEVKAELLACNYVVKSILGTDMRYFRPPGGDYDKMVIKAGSEEGFTMVLWTDDPGDYSDPGKKAIFDDVLARLSNGGVILLHDGVQQTIDILPRLITTIEKRGFRFQRIDEIE